MLNMYKFNYVILNIHSLNYYLMWDFNHSCIPNIDKLRMEDMPSKIKFVGTIKSHNNIVLSQGGFRCNWEFFIIDNVKKHVFKYPVIFARLFRDIHHCTLGYPRVGFVLNTNSIRSLQVGKNITHHQPRRNHDLDGSVGFKFSCNNLSLNPKAIKFQRMRAPSTTALIKSVISWFWPSQIYHFDGYPLGLDNRTTHNTC